MLLLLILIVLGGFISTVFKVYEKALTIMMLVDW